MLWWPRAVANITASLWLHPFIVWPTTAALVWSHHPIWTALALAPTCALLVAIIWSHWSGLNQLPRWAWAFNTPDSPTSPYSAYEPTAVPYYRLGWLIGDYLWLAYRNAMYGLAFRWGYWKDVDHDLFSCASDPDVKSVVDGRYVYGTFRCVIIREGRVVCWAIRRATRWGPIMWVEQWGWATPDDFWLKSDDVQKAQNIRPPAMLKVQIYPRLAK